MSAPSVSAHFESRAPSVIRLAQIRFAARDDGTRAINVAIGNVSLPMHPAMRARLTAAGTPGHAFADGRVMYTETVGTAEANRAVLNVIAASGLDTRSLRTQITDGGSQAMELVIVGLCGPAGSRERPLLVIDAAYTNYTAFAARLGRRTVSIRRSLSPSGKFSLPPLDEIERVMDDEKPGAMVVIPYDNPTGHYYDRETMLSLARLCVTHDVWMVSDEAYRELYYVGGPPTSIWSITDADVPGIEGRRVSIETTSKVWNACGLRIGALVTDNPTLHTRAVAENTASLCPNAIGQHIFGALAEETHEDLQAWFASQRSYYADMLAGCHADMTAAVPGIIMSSPDASIYSVVDVRDVVDDRFDALDFVLYCAESGRLDVDGVPTTLLTAPMAGFYSVPPGTPNPGRTQMRIAYVVPPADMRKVPALFAGLLEAYLARRGRGTA